LTSCGADIRAPNSYILYDSISEGYSAIAEHLIISGADVNARSALSLAVTKGLISVAERLIDYGANVEVLYAKNWRDGTILEEGGIGVQNHLGAYIASTWDTTPFHRACYENNIELLEKLLGKGSKKRGKNMINDRNRLGWTPLHVAAFLNRTVAAQLLIDNGADTSVTTVCGHTALHLACLSRDGSGETIIRILTYLAPSCVASKRKKKPKSYCDL